MDSASSTMSQLVHCMPWRLTPTSFAGYVFRRFIHLFVLRYFSRLHTTVVVQVAIIDIDVHHGNGTEEIVRQLPYADKIFFTSIHIFDSVSFCKLFSH